MALAHNVYIRSLNAIYLQSTSITSPTDIADFLVYCQCWYEAVHHHHDAEEGFLFPELEKVLSKPGIMAHNVEQHNAFHEKLDLWGKMTYEMKPEEYNGNEWRKTITNFATPLLTHLHDEIEGLEHLVQELDEECWRKMGESWKRFDEKMATELDKSRLYPLILGSVDCNFEGGKHKFPDIPFFVPYLVDWVYARKHRGSWRFSPSDLHGRPRPLEFAEA